MHWSVCITARIRLCLVNIGRDSVVSVSARCCLFGLMLFAYIWVLRSTRDSGDILASSSLVLPPFTVRVVIAGVDSVSSFIIYLFFRFIGSTLTGGVKYAVALRSRVMCDLLHSFRHEFFLFVLIRCRLHPWNLLFR